MNEFKECIADMRWLPDGDQLELQSAATSIQFHPGWNCNDAQGSAAEDVVQYHRPCAALKCWVTTCTSCGWSTVSCIPELRWWFRSTGQGVTSMNWGWTRRHCSAPRSYIQNSLQQAKRKLNTVHPLFIYEHFKTTENTAGIAMKKMLEALSEFICTKLNMQDAEDVPELIDDEAFMIIHT